MTLLLGVLAFGVLIVLCGCAHAIRAGVAVPVTRGGTDREPVPAQRLTS